MARYTLKIDSVCTGGEHIKIKVLKDGAQEGLFDVTKTGIMGIIENDLDWNDVVVFVLKKAVHNSGATTAAERKAAIEAAELVM
jgi:hypothetical protein